MALACTSIRAVQHPNHDASEMKRPRPVYQTDAVPDVSQPEPDAVPAAQPELDEEPPPPPQLLELEEVCPAPTEEIPEGTEHLVQEPDDEPSPDAEEEAERELLDAELGEACHDTGEPEQALWTRLRSVGGMTVPTESFLELCRELETCFCAYHAMHPDELSRERGVIRNATRMMAEKYSRGVQCDKILKVFVRVRTFIRLRTAELDSTCGDAG
ncbi:hypothetical protein FJT64_022914 [Amphibalanus amphitrite]|uniref:Uncharacterized protein n=1 Tax=Amphibalanus amphitrite TaxID=1232801 RepID=A0A6A4WNS8_AMPAM|nr:hypothetical protein FJT64_022914 [Amphibalanus amphitrite]